MRPRCRRFGWLRSAGLAFLVNRMRADPDIGLPLVSADSATYERGAADCRGSSTRAIIGFREVWRTGQRHLYLDVNLNEEALRDPLLIALGSLMMGARRGNVKKVLTFNYDSLLEWYLSLHGLSTSVVTTLRNWRALKMFASTTRMASFRIRTFIYETARKSFSDWTRSIEGLPSRVTRGTNCSATY